MFARMTANTQAWQDPSLLVESDEVAPALDYNGFILYASVPSVPLELLRTPTGSSIAEPGSIYEEENGRTYANHDTGRYFFPNDGAEQDRLDLQHRVCSLWLDGALYRAPLPANPRNVLDIATGTGIWAIQFAKQHPYSNVIGTDISLIQPHPDDPNTVDMPHNVLWVKEDAENQEWTHPCLFDYIHVRLVLSCFDDHLAVIRKAYDNLEPGGWIELMDPTFEALCTDGTCAGTQIERMFALVLEAGRTVGRDFCVARRYKGFLQQAGFVDVVEEAGPLPGNSWPSDPRFREIGRWQLLNMQKGIRGICWKLFRALGMTPEEIEVLVDQALNELRNTAHHVFFPVYVVYGRKPFANEIVPGQ